MPYIGNEVGNRFVASKAASVYSGDGSTTAFTLEHAVGSDEDILVSVDGVIQEPSVAYAVSSGTTLTFTAAPSSNSGNNIFVYYLFRTVATVDHPSTSSLQATDGTFSAGVTATTGTFSSTLNVTGETTLATHLNLGDSDKIKLGAAGDLEVYHDGSNSYIDDTGTGNLRIRANDQIKLQKYTGENMFVGIADGASSMYHDNVQKIATTSTGVDVTGTITLSYDGSDTFATIKGPSNRSLHIDLDANGNTDSFKIRDLRDNSERLVVRADGLVTMPSQSAFLATNTNANQTNFAVGALVDVNFGVEVFDQNADFASSTFTAPVAGKYQFNVNCRLDDMDSASNYYLVRLVTSNRNYTHIWDSNEFSSDTNYFSLQVSCLADMDASDTAKVIVYQNNGTQQTAVIDASYFSGHLVC